MGKTPKSKNVNNRGKFHLQPRVMLHKTMISGMGKMSIPGISEQSAPPKRRMKLSGTLSRKSSHGKGVIIKGYSSSIAEQSTGASRIPRMSVVAAESSDSIAANHQPELILENGKEDIQASDEVMSLKDRPLANGTESEVTMQSKEDTVDVNEIPGKQAKEINSIQEPVGDADSAASVKLVKDEDVESKKRSGTPQSRSSTPQRKSGRVRSKHGSPNKTNAATTLTPGLKVLKINMTPGKTITNGTSEDKSRAENDVTKGKNVKAAESEPPKIETNSAVENAGSGDSAKVASGIVKIDVESSKASPADVNAPYLRSLRMVSGRRSLSSNSPSKSLPIISPGNINASSPQWRKRQSRKKEAATLKNDSEQQGTESELNSSVSSGKRKAERSDEQGVSSLASNVKKSKNEDDDIKLFLSDESEDNNHLENDSDEFFNSSHLTKSSDDVMEELKDLNESASSDVQFVKNESMEYAYEAREVESSEKLHESPTAANESSTKRWCILM